MRVAVTALLFLTVLGVSGSDYAKPAKSQAPTGNVMKNMSNGTSQNVSLETKEKATKYDKQETETSTTMPHFLILVFDYIVNITTLNNCSKTDNSHEDKSQAAGPLHLLNYRRAMSPTNTSALVQKFSPGKIPGPSKLAGTKADHKSDEKNEAKRSDANLLFLIEVILVVTVSAVVLSLLLKKPADGPARSHSILGGSKLPGSVPPYHI
ncbi:hypothetical protein BIW11_07306 [Tropilaelaps mercedesae]|uniref:Uncharacterized protein n=1 Tax=Tropilaelaps mercedesae TaxID=418985 RepID=A0A1V9XUN5_9ACAR|nr:hypothetical protein BIW11_07306 [Tropilaelaps mercedesae]